MANWSTGYYDGTYQVNRSNLGSADHIFYNKRFLRLVKNKVRMVPLGQPKPLPKGSGATVQFERYLNLPVDVSATHLAEGVNPNPTQFNTQKLQATIKEYGAFGQMTTLLKDTFIDRECKGAVDVFAEHAATVRDVLCHSEVACNGTYPMRGDLDANYMWTGLIGPDVSSTTVELLTHPAATGDGDDEIIGAVICITSGTGYGQARPCTDWVAADDLATVAPAWDVTPAEGDGYAAALYDETIATSGDKLNFNNLKRAVAILRANKAPAFEGGFYVGVVDPMVMEELQDDTVWQAKSEYQDDTELIKGEVGRLAGVRFVMETTPFRFPAAAMGSMTASDGPGYFSPTFGTAASYSNYDDANAEVTMVPIIGRECFGCTNLSTSGARQQPPIYTTRPGPNSTDEPLPRFSTVGWMLPLVDKSLNPLFGVSIGVSSNVA